MAWPPIIPPNNRQNATLELDNHPSDHNLIADALTALLPTAWVDLTLASGWTHDPTYGSIQYRKVGDIVQLRGSAGRTPTAAADVVLSNGLPAGFRVPTGRIESYFVQCYSGSVRMDVQGNGLALLGAAYKLGTPAFNYVNMSGVWWAT